MTSIYFYTAIELFSIFYKKKTTDIEENNNHRCY